MKTYRATCVLEGGARVVLTLIAGSSFAAWNIASSTYGDALRVCSVRRG